MSIRKYIGNRRMIDKCWLRVLFHVAGHWLMLGSCMRQLYQMMVQRRFSQFARASGYLGMLYWPASLLVFEADPLLDVLFMP